MDLVIIMGYVIKNSESGMSKIFILCSMLTFFRDVILPFFSYLSGKGLDE